ncbi:MAG TPA: hypothetical protein VFV65_02645, partial [Gemmatimonadales bacterium]|nr:hypothetical protein [Gemmatimonadales bacterium]
MNGARRSRAACTTALLTAGGLLGAGQLQAQGIGVELGWLSGSRQSYYVMSLGLSRKLSSTLSMTFKGTWYAPDGPGGGDLVGGGVDLSLWRGGNPGLYAVGGLGGGFGFSGADVFWGSYSIGAGWDFRLFSAVGLGVEARWVGLTQGGDEGVQVGV